jgi:hypothetical protein
MSLLVFILLLYFFIGFFSDLVLNYLSRQTYAPATVKALEIYFERKEIKSASWRAIISGVNAGLTIVGVLLIVMGLYKMTSTSTSTSVSSTSASSWHPTTPKQLLYFLLLAFPLGWIADVIIYKTQLFGPSLNPYYKIAGAGLWGALAFIFSIVVAYFLVKWTFKYF